MKIKAPIGSIYLFLGLLLHIEGLYAQCSMCRAVLETEEGGKAAEGLNNGILYLMVIPYLLVGLAVFMFYRYWRNRKEQPSSEETPNM